MKTKIIMAVLSVMLSLLASCSVDDDRDVCCYADTVRFRYLYRGKDRFREYISVTRYFLFGGDGRFLKEMNGISGTPGSVDISTLAPGGYTIVALGNLRDCSTLDVSTGTLARFRLQIEQQSQESGLIKECDRLYWGECAFTVKEDEMNSFTGEMSNIHCVLHVTLQWEGEPDFADGYSLQLAGLAGVTALNSEGAYSIDVHRFPVESGFDRTLRQSEILDGREIYSTLVTLRWTSAHMPVLTLINDGRPITKDIDLGWVFRNWRWNPQRDDVQNYGIRLRIRSDDTIEIFQGSDMSVSDWIDGGYIG